MEIKIIKDSVPKAELQKIAQEQFGDMVKAVVDVEKEIMAIGGELHADGETVLMENHGSKREHIWGINIYPEKLEAEWIEFNSMINLKPSHGNRSRGVENEAMREKIREIVQKLIQN